MSSHVLRGANVLQYYVYFFRHECETLEQPINQFDILAADPAEGV